MKMTEEDKKYLVGPFRGTGDTKLDNKMLDYGINPYVAYKYYATPFGRFWFKVVDVDGKIFEIKK